MPVAPPAVSLDVADDSGARAPSGPRVYPVKEYQPVDVPLADLIESDGTLRINEEVQKRGYFSIRLKGSSLQFQAGGFVGLIPINDRVVIEVAPRVPIKNMSRLLRVSQHLPTFLTSPRRYAVEEAWNDSLLDLYARVLIAHLEEIADSGLVREYERRQEDSSFPRGRILVGETLSRLRPRGIAHKATVSWHQRTSNVPANRCLKYAVWFLTQRYIQLADGSKARRRLHRHLNALYRLFGDVDLDHRLAFLSDSIVNGSQPVPAQRSYYRPALDLAVSIIRQHAADVGRSGASVEMPSLILDMEVVFEAYLRNSLQTHAVAEGWVPHVLDGNTDGKKLLFDEKPSEEATPDIVLRDFGASEQKSTPILIEVKYVPVKKRLSSRDAIEQVITYAVSFRCKAVVLAHPRGPAQEFVGLRKLGTMDEIVLYQYIFDLGAEDLDGEDRRFGASIGELLASGG